MRIFPGDLVTFEFGRKNILGIVLKVNSDGFTQRSMELLESSGKICTWDIWPRETMVISGVQKTSGSVGWTVPKVLSVIK